jgi:hypothetical protein
MKVLPLLLIGERGTHLRELKFSRYISGEMKRRVFLIAFSGVLFILCSASVSMGAAEYFRGYLESPPLPYRDIYNSMWATFGESIFGQPTSKYYEAIWYLVMFLSIMGLWWGSTKLSARAMYYWVILFFCFFPIFRNNYLFPAVANGLDYITGAVINVMYKAVLPGQDEFDPVRHGDFANVSRMPWVALGAAVVNEELGRNISSFYRECYNKAVTEMKNKGTYNYKNPPDVFEIDYSKYDISHYVKVRWWILPDEISKKNCSDVLEKLVSDLGKSYKENLQHLKDRYQSALGNISIRSDADTLFKKLESLADNEEFKKQLFKQLMYFDYETYTEEIGFGPVRNRNIKEGLAYYLRQIINAPYAVQLLAKINGLSIMVQRYLPDFVGTVKIFLIVGFFVVVAIALLTGEPIWIIRLLGVWQFVNTLYIGSAVGDIVRFIYLFGSNAGTWNRITSTIGGIIGSDNAVMRGNMAYLAAMLCVTALGGLLTWKEVGIAGAYVSMFASAPVPKVPKLRRKK